MNYDITNINVSNSKCNVTNFFVSKSFAKFIITMNEYQTISNDI